MPQIARPTTDTFRSNWEEDDGTTDTLWGEIDETVVDDVDFIRTVLSPVSAVYTTKLSTLTDPVSSTGHILRCRLGKDIAGSDQIDITFQLRQGYVNETTQGTLIAQSVNTNVSAGFNTITLNLSGAEADSITDYTNLYVRLIGNKV